MGVEKHNMSITGWVDRHRCHMASKFGLFFDETFVRVKGVEKHMSITGLLRRISLIGIDVIW